MKYVILKDTRHGIARVHPLFFPEYMTHSIVAMGYAASFKAEEKHLLEIVSAGFCYYNNETERWVCHSGSQSLQIERSDAQDSVGDYVLNMFEAQQGIIT
jgi:hypothetical protein